MAHCLTNPTGNHEVEGLIPGLTQWLRDPALLQLWCGLAAAAVIRPLAWEPPCAVGAALEKTKRQKKKKKKKNKIMLIAATRMQLEILILSKSEKKDKQHITYMWNLKYGTYEPTYRTETRLTDKENKLEVINGEGTE